jgi:hypothetical protein
MNDQLKPEDKIKDAEQYEDRKQLLLRMLDDPQVQHKIVAFLADRSGSIRRHKTF